MLDLITQGLGKAKAKVLMGTVKSEFHEIVSQVKVLLASQDQQHGLPAGGTAVLLVRTTEAEHGVEGEPLVIVFDGAALNKAGAAPIEAATLDEFPLIEAPDKLNSLFA